MFIGRYPLCRSLMLLMGLSLMPESACEGQHQKLIVIAHRGASAYLPEHTLAAKALAYGLGADYIEQDVVLTRDDVPIVLHDIHLDTVTNVRTVFPDRGRRDGRFYAIDFSLAEIRQLLVHERINHITGKPVFSDRFPLNRSRFLIPTLAEEIELIQGLNGSSGRTAGIYPEIKQPAWHQQQGKDISRIVLKLLNRYGYRDRHDAVFLQCFDPAETARIRHQLKSNLPLVQLIGRNEGGDPVDYDAMRTRRGLKRIAEYADGIGPSLEHLVRTGAAGDRETTDLIENAHALGLVVHPYTLRADSLPEFASSFDDLTGFLINAGVDGVFTDFPDRLVKFRDR